MTVDSHTLTHLSASLSGWTTWDERCGQEPDPRECDILFDRYISSEKFP